MPAYLVEGRISFFQSSFGGIDVIIHDMDRRYLNIPVSHRGFFILPRTGLGLPRMADSTAGRISDCVWRRVLEPNTIMRACQGV